MAIHRGLGSIMPKITSHRAGIIITIIAAIMLITPLSSAERKVIVDMQEISDYDVNKLPYIKIFFDFPEDLKSISASRIILQLSRGINIQDNSVIFNNLDKKFITNNSSSREYKLFFEAKNITENKEHSIEFPLSFDNLSEYTIKIISIEILDEFRNEIQAELKTDTVKIKLINDEPYSERTVVVGIQASPETLSDINEKSLFKISFNFSEDIKVLSDSRVVLDIPKGLDVAEENIIFNNLNKKYASYNLTSRELKIIFDEDIILNDKDYSIEFSLTCDNFGDYLIKVKSIEFLDNANNKYNTKLNKDSINIIWNIFSCSDEFCEDQTGPIGDPYPLDNKVFQKIKYNCRCESEKCNCDENEEICDIDDLCEYISVEPSNIFEGQDVIIKVNYTELRDEVDVPSTSLSYFTDKNMTYNKTWENTYYVEQPINNLSLGTHDIDIISKFNFYKNLNKEKMCKKIVTVKELPGVDVYLYIMPSSASIGQEINVEIWCVNNNNFEIDNVTLLFKLPAGFNKSEITAEFPIILPNGYKTSKNSFKVFLKNNYIIKEYNYKYSCLNKLFQGSKVTKNEANFEIYKPPTLLKKIIEYLLSFLGGFIAGLSANFIYDLIRRRIT
jgi:hypothetical protein